MTEEHRRRARTLDIEALEKRLHYRFNDKSLLIRAMTHSSLSDDNNECMEFRGDKILGFLISEIIERKTPDYTPGERTELFSAMTNNRMMRAKIGRQWGLTPFIMRAPNTQLRDKNIADCVEALICAVYDDGGMTEAAKFLTRNWGKHLEQALNEAKSRKILSQYFNRHSLGKPHYREFSNNKEARRRGYAVEVPPHGNVRIHIEGEGFGRSQRIAKNEAARDALLQLGITNEADIIGVPTLPQPPPTREQDNNQDPSHGQSNGKKSNKRRRRRRKGQKKSKNGHKKHYNPKNSNHHHHKPKGPKR